MKKIILLILVLAPFMLSAKWDYVYKGNEKFKNIITKYNFVVAVNDSNKIIYSLNNGSNWDSISMSNDIYINKYFISNDSNLFVNTSPKGKYINHSVYKVNLFTKKKEIVIDSTSNLYSSGASVELFEFNNCYYLLHDERIFTKLNRDYTKQIDYVVGEKYYFFNTKLESINNTHLFYYFDMPREPYSLVSIRFIDSNFNSIYTDGHYTNEVPYPYFARSYPAGDSNWFFSNLNEYSYIENNGEKWVKYDNMSAYALGYGFSFVDDKFGYCIYSNNEGNKISYTVNKGRNWEFDVAPKDLKEINSIAAGKTYSYACGDGYILRTENITSVEDNQIQEDQSATIENIDANNLEIKLNLAYPATIEMQIVNTIGAIVQKVSIDNLSIGEFSRKIDISNLAQGTYFLQIIENNKVNSNPLKFVKLN